MKIRYERIDKNPKCFNCGKRADYNLKRSRFLYYYDCPLCFKCLKEHLKQLKVFIYRERNTNRYYCSLIKSNGGNTK